ncbi:MAG: PQQ-dependent sugar dehydrogenase [Phycisphaerales bacterium]|nr:PQQ-dependent sugar dehydrogenase [Phycisphaerales bacterium]
MRSLAATLASVAGLACAGHALAQPLDNPIPDPITKGSVRIELLPVVTGMAAPIDFTPAGDGSDRLFIADQNGIVRMMKGGVLSPTPFLDASSRLVSPLGIIGTHDEHDYDERGLLGITFHPGFANPSSPGFRKFYTYTSEPVAGPADFTTSAPPPVGREFDHQNVIAEWTVSATDPDRVDPASRREMIRIDQPSFNHNAGQIRFGPDNMLYITTGDGGAADDQDGQPEGPGRTSFGHGPTGNGQNKFTAHGKVLRIDPTGRDSANGQYGIPAGNPFSGPDGLRETYAYGFRNPFRFSFDSLSGDLIVADVGQNDIEEVDRVTVGGNYGWNLKEGSFKFNPNGAGAGFVEAGTSGLPPGLTDPILEYDHDEGIAIVGGFVYHGSAIPELEGKYVFGDFGLDFTVASGRLFYADLTTGLIQQFILGFDDRDLNLFVKGFGQDAAGEIYLLAGPNLGPYGTQGAVYRITAIPSPASLPLLALLAIRRRRHTR